MRSVLRHSRSLGVAVVVLAMTATVAFAAASLPGGGLRPWNRDQTTADASGGPEDSEAPESEAPESQAPESEAPDANTPDASGAPNHGTLVSTAANMATPDGFPNHGAFVSCVAQLPHDVDPTTFDWTTVTPDFCGLVSGVGTTGHGHGRHHGFAGTHTRGGPGDS